MEWDEGLFAFLDDLEGRAEALYDAERETDLVDRSRTEYAAVTLAGRLMASVGAHVVLDVLGVGPVAGVLQRVGPDWCLAHGSAQDWVVRLPAVRGRGRRVGPCGPRGRLVAGRPAGPGVGAATAGGRAGERCVVHSTDGTAREAVVARVGADFVEVTVGEGRSLLLARDAIAAVQSRG